MWIVRLALRRPNTFAVVAILIAVLGILSIATMPTDIFPKINIPVVSVIWTYGGLSPEEMQDRILERPLLWERQAPHRVTGKRIRSLPKKASSL